MELPSAVAAVAVLVVLMEHLLVMVMAVQAELLAEAVLLAVIIEVMVAEAQSA
jgi:hypothetical protein